MLCDFVCEFEEYQLGTQNTRKSVETHHFDPSDVKTIIGYSSGGGYGGARYSWFYMGPRTEVYLKCGAILMIKDYKENILIEIKKALVWTRK